MPKPTTRAGREALGSLKEQGKRTLSEGKDIIRGPEEDQQPDTDEDPYGAPPFEPDVRNRMMTPKGAPPTGAAGSSSVGQPTAPPARAGGGGRGGGGRGGGMGGGLKRPWTGGGGGKNFQPKSGGGFGGIMPEDLQLMQKGGSVEKDTGRKHYPWRTRESNPLPPPIQEEAPGYTPTTPEDQWSPPSQQPSVKRGAVLSFASGGSANYGKDYRKGK